MALRYDPLHALKEEVNESASFELCDYERNDGWDVIDVLINDHDLRGMSEGLTSLAHSHDFKVCGFDTHPDGIEVTLNRCRD